MPHQVIYNCSKDEEERAKTQDVVVGFKPKRRDKMVRAESK
jgi:hypothetical protein